MKVRQKITEVIITQSAEIASVLPQDDGTLLIVDIHGNPAEHIQHEAVGYLRDSGKPKILRSIPRTTVDRVGDNPWKKYDKIGFIDTNSVQLHDERLFVCSASVLLWAENLEGLPICILSTYLSATVLLMSIQSDLAGVTSSTELNRLTS